MEILLLVFRRQGWENTQGRGNCLFQTIFHPQLVDYLRVGPEDVEVCPEAGQTDLFRVQSQYQTGEGCLETSRWPRLSSCHFSLSATTEDLFSLCSSLLLWAPQPTSDLGQAISNYLLIYRHQNQMLRSSRGKLQSVLRPDLKLNNNKTPKPKDVHLPEICRLHLS